MISPIKCPHCKKVFFELDNKICPFCKKNINITSDILDDLFGQFGFDKERKN